MAVASILTTSAAVIITPRAAADRHRRSGGHRPRGVVEVGTVGGGGDDGDGGVGDAGESGGRVVSTSSTLASAFATSLLPWSLVHPRNLAAPRPFLSMTTLPMPFAPVRPDPAPLRMLTGTVAPFGIGGGLCDMRNATNVLSVMVITSVQLITHSAEREA